MLYHTKWRKINIMSFGNVGKGDSKPIRKPLVTLSLNHIILLKRHI